jgi:hypothetical protein
LSEEMYPKQRVWELRKKETAEERAVFEGVDPESV